MRILFLLKKKNPYGYGGDRFDGNMSTGLLNSVNFVAEALGRDPRIETKVIVVHDGNDIDRETTLYRPHVVILEALWCPPSKLDELKPLHPRVKWVVRLHSAMPFIANEGIAMEWIHEYVKRRNVYVAANDPRMVNTLRTLLSEADWDDKIHYQPNVYPTLPPIPRATHLRRRETLAIGCFGAIRPLKNQLAQAVAAIVFANHHSRVLHFHINGSRVEMHGSPVLKNIRALFNYHAPHRLIEHEWLDRGDFLRLCGRMEIGMQVSYTETFDVVAADMTSRGVPVVGSPDITWLPEQMKADPNSEASMLRCLADAYNWPWTNAKAARRNLDQLSERNLAVWLWQLGRLER